MATEIQRNGQFRDDVIDTLARLDTKMSQILEKDADKEKRIRSLEKKQWGHSAVVMIASVLLAKLGIPLPGGH